MQRLILHLGTHKTASTAIQILLSRNRKTLLDGGFFYPEPPQRPVIAQHSIAWEYAQRYNPKDSRPVSYRLIDALDDFRKSGAETLVLSSEDFLVPTFARDFLPDFFRAVRPEFDHITVGAYVRSRKGFFTSSYNQWVKSTKYDAGFESYLATILCDSRPQMRYTRALAAWAGYADTSCFLPFAIKEGGDSVESTLLTCLGIPRDVVSTFAIPDSNTANASLGPHAILAFLNLNRQLNTCDWFRRQDLAKRGKIQREALRLITLNGWSEGKLRVFNSERLARIQQVFAAEDQHFAETWFQADWYKTFPDDLVPDPVNEMTVESLTAVQRQGLDGFVAHMMAYARELYQA